MMCEYCNINEAGEHVHAIGCPRDGGKIVAHWQRGDKEPEIEGEYFVFEAGRGELVATILE